MIVVLQLEPRASDLKRRCLLTADGTDDDLVKPEGIADDAVPALPADLPHECLSEPGSVAWSKTTETQHEMVVVLQLNQGWKQNAICGHLDP